MDYYCIDDRRVAHFGATPEEAQRKCADANRGYG